MFLQVGNRFFVDYSLSISCLVLNSAKINKNQQKTNKFKQRIYKMWIRLFKNKVYIYNSFLFITAPLYFKKGSSVKCVDVSRIALTGRTEVAH